MDDSVTCVQFNPADENYFLSGSIDGKVRIFGVNKRRVVHWANVRDLVTAICYQPNGKVRFMMSKLFSISTVDTVSELIVYGLALEQGFVVGSLSGTCRFYETSGT